LIKEPYLKHGSRSTARALVKKKVAERERRDRSALAKKPQSITRDMWVRTDDKRNSSSIKSI